MVQFFGQRPIFVQNLTDAIGRGVQAGAVENQQALQQAIMFGQGLGQLGQGLVGTPQFRAEQRQNQRQDELMRQAREERERAADFEAAMELGIDIDPVRRFRAGEMTMEELKEEITVRNPPGVRKAEDLRDMERELEVRLKAAREARDAEFEDQFEGLATLFQRGGVAKTEDEAAIAAAKAMLAKRGALSEARDGLSLKDALAVGGTVEKALALMALNDSVEQGRAIPPAVTDILRDFRTPEATRVGQAAKRLEILEKRDERTAKEKEDLAARRLREEQADAEHQKLMASKEAAEVKAKSLNERIRMKTSELQKLRSQILAAEGDLAEDQGMGLESLSGPTRELLQARREIATSLEKEIADLQKQREELFGQNREAAGEAVGAAVEEAFGEED